MVGSYLLGNLCKSCFMGIKAEETTASLFLVCDDACAWFNKECTVGSMPVCPILIILSLCHYLGVYDADITLYEAIFLFCGLENRHCELSILPHSLSVISRPVLVAHFLW